MVAMTGAISGCAALHRAPMAQVQESATELNTNARFGRFSLASEYVDPAHRPVFNERHKGWGSRIRVVDLEMENIRSLPNDDVEVLVRLLWTFADGQDLRTTVLLQKWRNKMGWRLTDEQRYDGEPGIFGEKIETLAPTANASSRFATIRLE